MNEISSSLSEELAAARALALLLEQEQAAIAEADLQAIEAFTEKKADLIRRLAQLAEQRRQALATRGFSQRNEGMEDWLRSDGRFGSDSAAWHELRQIVEKARKLNQTNRGLIHMCFGYVERAITALQDASTATPPIYSPDGRRRPLSAPARVFARP